jgi:hypothetical protein
VPSEGVVVGEGSKEVRVFFSPDHQSKAYSDKLVIDYNDKVRLMERVIPAKADLYSLSSSQCGCNVMLSGKAWTNNMYVKLLSEGTMLEDFPAEDKESMVPAAPPPAAEDPPPPPAPTNPLLVMFIFSMGKTSKKILRREIEIGCVKSNLVKKTAGEFSIDVTPASNPFIKAFTFDVTKVSVFACE